MAQRAALIAWRYREDAYRTERQHERAPWRTLLPLPLLTPPSTMTT